MTQATASPTAQQQVAVLVPGAGTAAASSSPQPPQAAQQTASVGPGGRVSVLAKGPPVQVMEAAAPRPDTTDAPLDLSGYSGVLVDLVPVGQGAVDTTVAVLGAPTPGGPWQLEIDPNAYLTAYAQPAAPAGGLVFAGGPVVAGHPPTRVLVSGVSAYLALELSRPVGWSVWVTPLVMAAPQQIWSTAGALRSLTNRLYQLFAWTTPLVANAQVNLGPIIPFVQPGVPTGSPLLVPQGPPGFGRYTYSVVSDVAGTFYVQQSPDGVHADVVNTIAVTANTVASGSIEALCPYVAGGYRNGVAAQTMLRAYLFGRAM